MVKIVLIVLSIAMIVLGLALYASGHRTRKSLDVPLLSRHSKFFFGGSLVFFGFGFLAIALISTGQ